MTRRMNIAVLTVSDTRGLDEDTSGQYLVDGLISAGHQLKGRELCIDDKYQIRARVSIWIADPDIDCILVTGGTGFTQRDTTPDAVGILLEKNVDGFGELFRAVSYLEIGTATVQSRAFAGVTNETLVFCLPGSTGACRTAWDKILVEQLDIDHKPCNFAEILGR